MTGQGIDKIYHKNDFYGFLLPQEALVDEKLLLLTLFR